MTARLHDNGINHRDLYICHFLLQLPWRGPQDPLHLHLIDLHRVQIRSTIPIRWRIKDLAALHFSSLHIGLSRRDLMRFVRAYTGASLRSGWYDNRALWQAVDVRAQRLQAYKPVVEQVQADG